MNKRLVIPLVILIVTALVFGACKPEQEAPKEVRLGNAAMLSGVLAGVGKGGSFGLEAAMEDINKLGGVYIEQYGKKLPIRVIVADTESDDLKAATLSEDLILSDNVDFLINGSNSPSSSAAIARVAERYKVPFCSSTGPMEPWLGLRESITPTWKYSWISGFALGTPAPAGDFRSVPGYTVNDVWLAPLMQYGDQTNKKAGIFASDEPDGRGWYASMPGLLESAGFDVCGEERNLGIVPLATTDFTSLIREWMDYDCDILLGCHFGADFGTMLRQCELLDFHPKMVFSARAALFYEDVAAWGGDLPNGVGLELNWRPNYKDSPGIGGTTGESLAARWKEATGRPLAQHIGLGYASIQIMADSIERAGTLDRDAVLKALGETDVYTISHRAKFQQDIQFNRWPLAFTQWQKTDPPLNWWCPIVYSDLDFVPTQADFLFPIPYD